VIAVITYHANREWLGGGFLGVEVFFVISGYLITSIILKELITTGYFSFKYFYARRIRRILPVLLFVMLVSLPFAWIYLLPSSFADFSKSILYSLIFSSNFYFWYSGQQYGDESGLLEHFLHTWSLSVEEQYYIIFPIVLLVTFKYFKKYLIHILLFGFIVSLGLADWGSRNHPSFNFYVLPTRVWELLAGSIMAYFEITKGYRSKNQKLKEILEESSDDEIQYTAPKQVTNPVVQETITTPQPNIQPKPKQKRNLSEEQREVLRQRMKIAHAKKMELAAQRQAVRDEEEQNLLAQKQLRILEQARLIKQNHKKQLKSIDDTPVDPIVKVKPVESKKKVKYVVESESEDSEEEVVVVNKISKKPAAAPVAPVAPPVAPPVTVFTKPSFGFKFV
jgi:uncharacterized membrane protein